MVNDYPGQVQCILLRNTSSTDPEDKFPYDTSGFKGLNESTYMFFKVSVGQHCIRSFRAVSNKHGFQDDLINLDIAAGQCRNTTIPQNVTFSTQGLPFGLSKDKSAANYLAPSSSWAFALTMAMLMWGIGLGL